MSEAIAADDPLYRELYDVRREAETMGNLIEGDMNPAIAALRAQSPVHVGTLRSLLGLPAHQRHALAAGRRSFCVLNFAGCEAALRDHVRFSSSILHHPNPANEKTMGVLEMDGIEHRAYRKVLQPMFLKPQAQTWWRRRWIDESVARLVERLKSRDRAELNLDFCARIPVHTITTAIGMEGEDALSFRIAWVKSSAIGGVPAEVQRQAAAEVEQRLLDLIARRRAAPGDDVISRLIETPLELAGEPPRRLTDREVMINARLIMVAGGGTSWRQMGIALWALLTHPEQLEAVRTDRRLLERAVDESVRWNGNASLFSRLALKDTELEGVSIPAGSVLEIWLMAGNRDPARWSYPDVYDLHRPSQYHVGFGIGQHRCLGLNVAHNEIQAGISALMDAFPRLRLDSDAPPPVITGGLEQRGMSALPVLLS
jgi:cytochrome P450